MTAALLHRLDEEYRSEFILDVVIPPLGNGDFTVETGEETKVRRILYRKAGLYLGNDKSRWADASLGLRPMDRLDELRPLQIAALEKFQRSLLERATPTPPPMRR